MAKSKANETLVGDLVVAMLAVNNWPLEKACELRPDLEKSGLCDAKQLSTLSPEEVFARLKKAGYTKADYVVGLLADRLRAMAMAMSGTRTGELQEMMRPGRAGDLDRFLLAIKGVGPAVLETFKALRRIRQN